MIDFSHATMIKLLKSTRKVDYFSILIESNHLAVRLSRKRVYTFNLLSISPHGDRRSTAIDSCKPGISTTFEV